MLTICQQSLAVREHRYSGFRISVISTCFTEMFDLVSASEEPRRDNMAREATPPHCSATAQITLNSVKFALREFDFFCALSKVSINY